MALATGAEIVIRGVGWGNEADAAPTGSVKVEERTIDGESPPATALKAEGPTVIRGVETGALAVACPRTAWIATAGFG